MKKLKPNTKAEVHMNLSGRPVVKYVNTRTGEYRRSPWTSARVPGTVRKSRMPGGSGFRNNWEGALP